MTTTGTLATAPDPPEALDVVETPTSPSSNLARSRFEFETDKRNEGTKILMVEWDDNASVQKQEDEAGSGRGYEQSSGGGGGWDVSWEGKGAVLPVWDVDPETSSNDNIQRVYYLLPPGAPIPTLVSIAREGRSGEPRATILRTKPLPAIFPAELTSKQDAGRRGVLHTMWAKKRVAELRAEIEAEMRTNGESVGLEMALQELQWIVDHFGLVPDPGLPQSTRLLIPQNPAGPASPRSPLGGRLGEKLRGLKLATSPAELAAASQAAAKSAQGPQTHPLVTSVSPPASGISVSAILGSGGGGVGSLNAIVGGAVAPATAARFGDGEEANEEELFALPMSPRSPEMKRSPFSIL
ncbi:hypothetical protein N657DRAFT_10623 [Parathielavia appendiculata]|uniref:Uncharacterized protein n=1 Tax=Parathielavia appendiculata TaxID=2587402 RepID=A0AAN6U882_9PEZI|nr:hypothetical protein N657DRAFT_10623 [Parathielavia appendiculata]